MNGILPPNRILPANSLPDEIEGEQYAIALALARRLPLLIEDRLGRQFAAEEGLIVSGIAGQILTAYYRGLLTAAAAREQFQRLYEVRRINRRLLQQLIESL